MSLSRVGFHPVRNNILISWFFFSISKKIKLNDDRRYSVLYRKVCKHCLIKWTERSLPPALVYWCHSSTIKYCSSETGGTRINFVSFGHRLLLATGRKSQMYTRTNAHSTTDELKYSNCKVSPDRTGQTDRGNLVQQAGRRKSWWNGMERCHYNKRLHLGCDKHLIKINNK